MFSHGLTQTMTPNAHSSMAKYVAGHEMARSGVHMLLFCQQSALNNFNTMADGIECMREGECSISSST